MTDPVRILIRCDGSSHVGMGHVVRCLALADELRARHRCTVAFAMRTGPAGYDKIQKRNYSVFCSEETRGPFDYSAWLLDIIDTFRPNAFIMDVRDDLPVSVVGKIRQRKILIVTLDDASERRLSADMVFSPPVPQLRWMHWTRFSGTRYCGWEWILLRPEFSQQNERRVHDTPEILVTMGGSDPQGMTQTAIMALHQIADRLNVTVVIGSAFVHERTLEDQLQGFRHRCRVIKDAANMAEIMQQSDIAIASFGITAYELVATRVPSILLCLTDDHAESASSMAKEGVVISLGNYMNVSPEQIAAAVRDLLHNPQKCREMSENSRRLIDGRGAERAAREIIGHIDAVTRSI